jgi:hypothetical protein
MLMADEQAKKPKLEVLPPVTPSDAADIEALWLDPGLGDGITDTHQDKIPIGKPRNFFRVHPDKQFRRRTEIYVHKPEDAIEPEYYIIAPAMRGQLLEARFCVIVPCIYRDGNLRLWPIPFPRAGEKDNSAWSSGRRAAREAIDKWIRLLWAGKSYQWREAEKGYAPDPDWNKVPSLNDMLKLAVGANGIIRDKSHPIYRDLMGAAAKKAADAGADIGGDDGSDDDL